MIAISLALLALSQPGTVIKGGLVYDGHGGAPRQADVRIVGDTIRQVGNFRPQAGDQVIDATGLAVSPGFIDAHSHADGGIFEDPNAETQIRQGITTSVVGEDGFSALPITDFLDKLKKTPSSLNFATFAGHGSIRAAVIGNVNRKATPAELEQMEALVEREMRSGALGLSTGLEYEPGRYGDIAELIDLSKVAAKHHGIYISHVRNEDNHAIEAFTELIEIARKAKLPAEINHIKLCSTRVWGKAPQVLEMMASAKKEGIDITADVYPYLYWQSTIRVIIETEQFDDRKQWEQGLSDVGGPAHVLLTTYTPDPAWQGKTIAEIASETGKDPITIIQGIIEACYGKGNHGEESVVVTAMSDADLKTFIGSPKIMFCSDGGLNGTHPRGAGSFPRVLGVYARQYGTLTLQEAIRKMTSYPAWRFGFKDRGVLAPGKKADIVLFNPETVLDTATTKAPRSAPIGLPTVLVNGTPVLLNGVVTGAHPGVGIYHKG
jgi:N-acyl-D-amino-acid deacylase